jgi:cadmium resistance transport/sequestration family protein
MHDPIAALIAGITAFVATNLDDLVILIIFFAQRNAGLRLRQIVAGKYLGLTAIILLSLPGFLGGLFLPSAWIGLLGLVPMAIGLHQFLSSDDGDTVQTVTYKTGAVDASPRLLAGLLAPQTYYVAAVTLANGGDNVGIYLPLFASSSPAELLIILATFFGLLALWCALVHYIARHPAIAPLLTRYGRVVIPYVLIGLGLFILIDNRSYQLLFQLLP